MKDLKKRIAVSGAGRFPLDMLRYDLAYPASEHDSAVIEGTFYGGTGRTPVTVSIVTTRGGLTEGRWESFGWKVVRGAR